MWCCGVHGVLRAVCCVPAVDADVETSADVAASKPDCSEDVPVVDVDGATSAEVGVDVTQPDVPADAVCSVALPLVVCTA